MRWAALGLVALVACRSTPSSPYTTEDTAERNTIEAQRLSREAAPLIAEDPELAEDLLRKALAADIFYGPAHNNLGVLFLKRGDLFEAAKEFEWARKLMPGHPDPRLNLAMTLEMAGRTDEAIQTYRTALEVFPGHIPTIQALARAFSVARPHDPELGEWLHEVALQGETDEWSLGGQVKSGQSWAGQTRPVERSPGRRVMLTIARCPASPSSAASASCAGRT